MEDERGIRRRREERKRGDVVSPKLLRGNTKYTLQERRGGIWGSQQCCYLLHHQHLKTPKQHLHHEKKPAGSIWNRTHTHNPEAFSFLSSYQVKIRIFEPVSNKKLLFLIQVQSAYCLLSWYWHWHVEHFWNHLNYSHVRLYHRV